MPTITDTTVARIDRQHHLAAYWFGEKWCPAVTQKDGGYQIRVGRDQGNTYNYEYFELDAEGLILRSPRGWAKDYNKRVRVADIAEVAKQTATPDPAARRFMIGF